MYCKLCSLSEPLSTYSLVQQLILNKERERENYIMSDVDNTGIFLH